jgi:MFS transporter, MHS family, proline/betaine transporter
MHATPVGTPAPADAPAPSRPTGTTMAALATGTFVEWFDFALYGFSSAVIATQFFPSGHPDTALLATLAIYGVSFVVRPIGGVVFGRIGDRAGRRAALSLSLVLMGLATAAIGVIPSFASIGICAPLLLVACRLLQGFAASSELVGATTFVAESAPDGRRGLWANRVGCFASIGTAAATVLVLLFRLSPGGYEHGGWRWPFVIGGAIAISGMYLRLRLEETPVYREARSGGPAAIPTLGAVVARHWRSLLVLVVFYALVGIGFQTLVGYMPTYMTTVAGISSTAALLISLCAFLTFAASLNLFGHLSDRVGRKPVMVAGAIAMAVLTVPAYLMICTGNIALMCAAQALLVMPIAAVQATGNIANAEIFPPAVRYSAVALGYTVSYAAFAGTAPLLEDLLLHAGGRLMPALYGVLVAVAAVPVLHRWFPESRFYPMGTGHPGAALHPAPATAPHPAPATALHPAPATPDGEN